eukprot:g4345.t1 g4345   contig15:840084-840341(-)
MESGDDDFWGDNDNEELSRKRTESGTSAMGSSNKLEPLVTIPHGRNATVVTGWEQRVGVSSGVLNCLRMGKYPTEMDLCSLLVGM